MQFPIHVQTPGREPGWLAIDRGDIYDGQIAPLCHLVGWGTDSVDRFAGRTGLPGALAVQPDNCGKSSGGKA